MPYRIRASFDSRTADRVGKKGQGNSAQILPSLALPRPRVTDLSWAPQHATVGMVDNEHEAKLVYQLRYRVYVHEQGKRPEGVDWERNELVDPLDAWSRLWVARDGEAVIGTVAQTIIGAGFDLSLLPSALQLERFPCSVTCPLGFSSRFAIAPDYRSMWVLPSLARYSYAYGRELGAKFDFMATNPGLVPLFERLGYVRYTASAVQASDVGLLIPMVLPATDYDHLRNVRSACLPAAAHFSAEPEWGAWLRDTHPIIGVYYGSDARHEQRDAMLAERMHLPVNVAVELAAMSFVHHFPAGTALLRKGDRVTCSFLAVDGRLRINRVDVGGESVDCAPDGVALSRVAIQCETDTFVLCVPNASIARVTRRYPEHGARLQEFVEQCIAPDARPT